MKLFMFYVGGSTQNSNTELHDVRFSVGDVPEDCYDDLKRQWWGTPESLHLDCWGAVEQADGFDIHIGSEPDTGDNKLFFVNLGGYDPEDFSELHKNILVVAPDASKAKVKALKTVTSWQSYHRDQQFEVEHMLSVTDALAAQKLHVRLTPATEEKPFKFTCKFKPLG